MRPIHLASVVFFLSLLAQPALAEPLALELITVPESALPAENERRWYDFSGLVVTRTLERFVSGTERILLPDDDYVILYLRDGETLTQVRFSRRRASRLSALENRPPALTPKTE